MHAKPLSALVAFHHAKTGGAAWQTAKRFRLPRREVKQLLAAVLRVGTGCPGSSNAKRYIAAFDNKWRGR